MRLLGTGGWILRCGNESFLVIASNSFSGAWFVTQLLSIRALVETQGLQAICGPDAITLRDSEVY